MRSSIPRLDAPDERAVPQPGGAIPARPVSGGRTRCAIGGSARSPRQRYDVPDAPMQGEMDPFFFLTKHKNFIPHEYPCRTQFAAERRGKRPRDLWRRSRRPAGGCPSARRGSTSRASGSGRRVSPPGRETCHRRRRRRARRGCGSRTCGGAILFVNGEEVGWMAPYRPQSRGRQRVRRRARGRPQRRSRSGSTISPSAMRASSSSSTISAGPAAAVALPIAGRRRLSPQRSKPLLDGHAFRADRLSLAATWRSCFPSPLPADAHGARRGRGRLLSSEAFAFDFDLRSRRDGCRTRPTRRLPADFRHFKVTLDVGGFIAVARASASRSAMRAAGRRRPPRSPRASRRRSTKSRSMPRPTRCAPGAAGDRARRRRDRRDDRRRAAGDRGLPRLRRFHPGAAALGARSLGRRHRRRRCARASTRAILGYRYWMDEPGNDVQWYFSENHALLFHTAAYLAGASAARRDVSSAPAARAREQSAVGRGARARLARPFRAMGDGRVQLGAVFPDRPQGPDRALRAGAGRRYPRARRRGDRPPARDRRPLGASRHADRRAGPLLRAHAARRALARALRHRRMLWGKGYTAGASMRCRCWRSACATMA